jgi:hypothetical protein
MSVHDDSANGYRRPRRWCGAASRRECSARRRGSNRRGWQPRRACGRRPTPAGAGSTPRRSAASPGSRSRRRARRRPRPRRWLRVEESRDRGDQPGQRLPIDRFGAPEVMDHPRQGHPGDQVAFAESDSTQNWSVSPRDCCSLPSCTTPITSHARCGLPSSPCMSEPCGTSSRRHVVGFPTRATACER